MDGGEVSVPLCVFPQLHQVQSGKGISWPQSRWVLPGWGWTVASGWRLGSGGRMQEGGQGSGRRRCLWLLN